MFRHRPPRLTPFLRETNPAQAHDSARAWVRAAAVVVVAGATAAAFSLPGPTAPSSTPAGDAVTVVTASGQSLE
jgi:hypothetical protein